MPSPRPLTAQISGFGKSTSASSSPRKPCLPGTKSGSVARACISSRSVPALNARPLPVSSTTATPGSAAASSSASVVASYSASLKALSASGRSRVMVRTRLRSSICSVMGRRLERVPLSASVGLASDAVDQERDARLAPRLAVLGRRGARRPPARRAATRRTGSVGDAALARHPYAGGAGHAGRSSRARARASSAREAWGPGADWVLDVGAGAARRRGRPVRVRAAAPGGGARPGAATARWRIGRTGLVMEALVPAIIEQKVTGQEAFAGFRMLVHRFGERAPGPGAEHRLWVQPSRRHDAAGPVVGVAADARRPGPLAHARDRGPRRRLARAHASGCPATRSSAG